MLTIVMVLTLAVIYGVDSNAQTDLSYPAQAVQFVAYGGEKALNITGYGDGSRLNAYYLNGEQNNNWRIDYISDGLY